MISSNAVWKRKCDKLKQVILTWMLMDSFSILGLQLITKSENMTKVTCKSIHRLLTDKRERANGIWRRRRPCK